jgi:Zn-dependent protease/predicted transcriptional regulator
VKIARIFGIDIFVNVSWLFVFALVAWSLAGNAGPLHAVRLLPLERAFLAVLTALLFFVSVLLHELAHSLVARARGVPIRGITLFIFGGVSMMEGEPPNAPAEAWISVVGPLTSLLLWSLFGRFAHQLSAPHHLAMVMGGDWRGGFAVAFSYLSLSNFLLALFNLLPAYPLDGGRVLHALVWRATNDRNLATTVAVIAGRSIAAAFVLIGILWTVTDGLGGGIWLTFLGWFLLQAGEAERVAARVTEALRGHRAAELAQAPKVRIAADQTAASALDVLLHDQVNSAPVFIGERLIGIVTLQGLVRVADPTTTYVTATMTKISEVATIRSDAEAVEVTRRFARGGQPLLPVLDNDGEVLGFITREIVLAWMMASTERGGLPWRGRA